MEITDGARDFLTEKGYDPQYGARPLKRAVQKYLEDELAEAIIKGEIEKEKVVHVDYKEGDSLLISCQ